ncbi:MAG: hypothetical protein IIW77_06110 [Bacteroidaceae bacterium]|nr:hypothetical protein [Bacteroidaceae bacterium]
MSKDYKIGDHYLQMTLGYFLHLDEGGDEDAYPENEQYADCIIRYITPEGGLVMQVLDSAGSGDGTFDTSSFTGEMIKEIYPDFDGDDDAWYFVPYFEGYPFYS